MAKSIGLFIDGTWNTVNGASDTNVRKLFELANHGGGSSQPCCYIPGVGESLSAGETSVDDASDAWLADFHELFPRPRRTWLRGGVGGSGTAYRIREAYAFLCYHYEQYRGDKVYVFGFSRGAFAARSLVGFASKVGVLLKNHIELLPVAYQLYEQSIDVRHTTLQDFVQHLTGRGLIPDHQDDPAALKVHFLGLWDIVGALGLPRRMRVFSAPFTEYHEVETPPNIMRARHAMALHEFREDFPLTTWSRTKPGLDFQQVWFTGAHADVGGGYAIQESALSDKSLKWMADEARQAGLWVSTNIPSDHDEVLHQQWLWHLVGKPRVRQYLRACVRPASVGGLCDGLLLHDSVASPAKPQRPAYTGRLRSRIQPCIDEVQQLLWHAKGRSLVPAALPALKDTGDSFWRAGASLPTDWWLQTSLADLAPAKKLVVEFSKNSRVTSLEHQEKVMRALIMRAVVEPAENLMSHLLLQDRALQDLNLQPNLPEEEARFTQEHAITIAQAIRNCIRCGAPGDAQMLERMAGDTINTSRTIYMNRFRARPSPRSPLPLLP